MEKEADHRSDRQQDEFHDRYRLQTDAETTGAQAEKVSSSAEQTAAHTALVTDSATELEEVMKVIDRRIASQKEPVEGIVDKNGLSQAHMQELAQAVGDIDSIIVLVHEITEQTQLLALNAAIEAARAGEFGKGFSVVAAEMKALSDSTAKAASEVRSRVAAINGAGSTLKSNFHEIGELLDTLTEVTGGITADIAVQQTKVAVISSLAVKTSANTRKVSASIRQVTGAACGTSLHARNVHDCADAIAMQLALLADTTATLTRLREHGDSHPEEAKTKVAALHSLPSARWPGKTARLQAA